jgi:hypothetical protein
MLYDVEAVVAFVVVVVLQERTLLVVAVVLTSPFPVGGLRTALSTVYLISESLRLLFETLQAIRFSLAHRQSRKIRHAKRSDDRSYLRVLDE